MATTEQYTIRDAVRTADFLRGGGGGGGGGVGGWGGGGGLGWLEPRSPYKL